MFPRVGSGHFQAQNRPLGKGGQCLFKWPSACLAGEQKNIIAMQNRSGPGVLLRGWRDGRKDEKESHPQAWQRVKETS